jgi:lysophospholipase L1-like esterase
VSRLYYRATPSVSYAAATVPVTPDNAAFGASDLAGTASVNSSRIRLTRSTTDAVGYQHAAPGARVRFRVTLAAPGQVVINLQYTGLITRNDTYEPDGCVLVDGAVRQTFTGPSKGPSDPHPVAGVTVTLSLLAGAHTVEIIFPYCASIDFEGVSIPTGASVSAAPARPTKRGVFFGDSITHGFNADNPQTSWPYLTAAAESAQILNHGYGSRQLQPVDGTTCGSFGADFGVYLIGYNNFTPGGGSLATFETNYEALLNNFRAASTTAGKPNAPLYVITPLWSSNDTGNGGPLVGNSPTLEQFRQAIRDAVADVADPLVTLVEGRGAGMPSGLSEIIDGVHPGPLGAAKIVTVVSGVIA